MTLELLQGLGFTNPMSRSELSNGARRATYPTHQVKKLAVKSLREPAVKKHKPEELFNLKYLTKMDQSGVTDQFIRLSDRRRTVLPTQYFMSRGHNTDNENRL